MCGLKEGCCGLKKGARVRWKVLTKGFFKRSVVERMVFVGMWEDQGEDVAKYETVK